MTAPADTIEPCRFEPGDTQAENEMICERLLRLDTYGMPLTFTDWASAGLILEALQGSELRPAGKACESLAHELIDGLLTPELVRAAALSYLRSTT